MLALLLATVTLTVSAGDVVVMAIFGEMVILKVDGTKHKLKVGDKTPEGIMLTQVDSDRVELKVENKKNWYVLGGRVNFGTASSNDHIADLKESIAKISPRNDMYITRGLINGTSVEFLVDTGATWIAMGEGVARRIGINYRRGLRSRVGTANGIVPVFKVKLKTVKVGNILLRNVTAGVIENYKSHQVLLGNSFLKHVEMTRKRRVMILKMLEVNRAGNK